MARAATTSDVFNAVAEQRRREIIDVLATGEVGVGELVDRLAIAQPLVSKHLKVLRDVGLVRCRTSGRRRLYRLHGPALGPITDWLARLTAEINARYDRLDDLLVELQREDPPT